MADEPWLVPRSAYLHIPFCAHHCGYCDFAVTAGRDELIEPYLAALRKEIEGLKSPRPVDTVFLGGGTPTYLSAPQLENLLATIHQWLPPADGIPHEFSIEATPESVTEEKLQVLKSGGVTRISLGIQSFAARTLSTLDRIHRNEQISPAIELIRRTGFELSLDLIFAAPGSSLADWQADLSRALGDQPDHLSTYGLTYEKGTPLWKQRERGGLPVVGEDAELAMYESGLETLTSVGYEQYEVSNFARPGKRCRHNERYWANEAYFGFGVGAARYVGGVRELNVRNTADYIRRIERGESPTFQSEELSPRDRAIETMATQLRRSDGIERTAFHQQTGYALDDLAGDAIRRCVDLALLKDTGARVSWTRKGVCVVDGIVTDLMTAAR